MRRNWKQREEESCGAAALMTALAEIAGGSMLDTRELDLWRAIRADGPYQGSLPGRIATRAVQEGAKALVLVDQEHLSEIEARLGDRATFDVADLLRQHRIALDEAEAVNVDVRTRRTDPRVLLQTLHRGWRLMVAFAISTAEGVTLHWRLYRGDGDTIWEMDPADGHDTPLTENQFAARLKSPDSPYIGLAVALASQVTPPAP